MEKLGPQQFTSNGYKAYLGLRQLASKLEGGKYFQLLLAKPQYMGYDEKSNGNVVLKFLLEVETDLGRTRPEFLLPLPFKNGGAGGNRTRE